MKSKNDLLFMYLLLLSMAVASSTNAQLTIEKPSSQMHNGHVVNGLTTRIFLAPNNTYGYDILNNGKLMYHHPAFSKVVADGDVMLIKKEHATIAAMMALDKIRQGKNPELTDEELKKIIAH
jgi:hypothetical protein